MDDNEQTPQLLFRRLHEIVRVGEKRLRIVK